MKPAFSLVELVVTVGVVSILLSVVLITINPSVQFARANDAKRRSDITQIYNSLLQYATDSRGTNPTNVPINTTSGPVTLANQGGIGLDLCTLLVPKYLAALPIDPALSGSAINTCGSTYNTGYSVQQDQKGRISVFANGAIPRIIAGASTDIPYLWYRLDEAPTATESIGVSSYQIPASHILGSITTGAGKYGNAFIFNGSTQYISLSSGDQVFSSSSQRGLSVSAWVNLSGTGTRMIYAERNNNPSTVYRIALYADASHQIVAGIKTDDLTGGPSASVTSMAITPGTWYHVELTYAWDDPSTSSDDSAQKLILYINGSPITNAANPTATSAFPSTTYPGAFGSIGASPWGGDYFSGSIDDLRIYRYARTAPEVQNDMNNIP